MGQAWDFAIGNQESTHFILRLAIEFANSRMAPQKSSVSKKKFNATTSVGAARSIATHWELDP
jgi:hypothetical protein